MLVQSTSSNACGGDLLLAFQNVSVTVYVIVPRPGLLQARHT